MIDNFHGAIANWSCAIAGTIDFGPNMPTKVRWCVTEVVKELAEIGSAKWFANGHSRDTQAVSEEVSVRLIELLGPAGEVDEQAEFDALVMSVRGVLTESLASLEEAARFLINEKGE